MDLPKHTTPERNSGTCVEIGTEGVGDIRLVLLIKIQLITTYIGRRKNTDLT